MVTGASSGIGEATARRLAAEGYEVIAAARRADRLATLAAETGARAVVLDVTDEASVRSLADSIETCSVLVNNAGGAFGLAPISAADDDDWQRMWDVNVMGTMRMTRALLPKLEASGDGVIVTLTSTAGHVTLGVLHGSVTSRSNIFSGAQFGGTVTLNRGLGASGSGGDCTVSGRLHAFAVTSIRLNVS